VYCDFDRLEYQTEYLLYDEKSRCNLCLDIIEMVYSEVHSHPTVMEESYD